MNSNLPIAIFGAFFTVLSSVAVAAQVAKCPTDYGPHYFQGGPNREDKSFAVFKDMNEISDRIRTRVEGKLQAHLGKKFRPRIFFEEGIARDFDDERPLQPHESSRIDAYQFNFTFRIPERGLDAYRFTISTNKFGQVYGSLKLPALARQPKKGLIIGCSDIVQRVKTQNLLPNFSETNHYIEMAFDGRTRSFAWDISTYRPRQGRGLVSDHMLIDAVSGKIIKRWVEHAAF